MTGNLVNLSPICSGGTETIPKMSRAHCRSYCAPISDLHFISLLLFGETRNSRTVRTILVLGPQLKEMCMPQRMPQRR